MNRESHDGGRISSGDRRRRNEEAAHRSEWRTSSEPEEESASSLGQVTRKRTAAETEEPAYKPLPLVVRMLLWLLRKSIVPILLVLALVGGAFIGYVMLGEGDRADVWKWETWRHLYDLIFMDS